jgi:hypothetical protein
MFKSAIIFRRNLVGAAVILSLTLALIAAPVLQAAPVYAADYEQWEDCDWDGFDDHTGVPVPWAGFDGTRGDTPAGPSADSQTGKKKAQEEAAKDNSSGSSSSKASESKSSESKSETKKQTKTKSDSKTKSKTSSKTVTKKSSDKENVTDDSAATLDEEKIETDEDASKTDKTKKKSSKKKAKLAAAQKALDEAVIAQKGAIEISESDGNPVHAGSSVIIKGTGFYGGADELDVEIHSTPTLIGKAATSDDGSFEVEVLLPENIGAGSHNIVVLYKGTEIARQPVELASAPADSFISALTVGFTEGGPEFYAGIIIIGALAALSALALLLSVFIKRKKVKILA